jgi:hypothetical protein
MYAHRDSNGYPMGSLVTPDAPANGTVYGAYLYNKHISIGGATQAIETRSGRAGGKTWTKKVVGFSDIADFPVEMSGKDTTLESFFQGYTPDTTTVGTAIVTAPGEFSDSPPKFLSVHHMEYDNADGSSEWLSLNYLNAQFSDATGIAAGQGSGENPNPFTWNGTPDFSLRAPWGQLFSASNLTLSDDRATSIAIYSQWRYAMATYIDDGAATTFTLPYLPASSVVTNSFVFKNGVATAPASISTSTGIVTITAGTAADIWVVLYPVGETFTASP